MTTKTTGDRSRTGLAERFAAGETLILDGANGTELERRRVPSELPLWTTHALTNAPDTVREIHADYAAAGADVLTANTFRTQRRTLARANRADRAAELTGLAVLLARRAVRDLASRRAILVAGSAPPLEDCYRPDLVPDDSSLLREHAEHAEHLAAAGVDAILVETMNCVREADAAVRAARATDLPVLVSFVCWDGARLLSGEPLSEALDAVADHAPDVVAVNCLPPSNVDACLPALLACGLPFGVYCNLGAPLADGSFARSEDCGPSEFARLTAGWRDRGARLLGGCCGTTPEHIRSLAQLLRN